MKARLSSIIKFLFFIGLGILLIWLVVKDITPEEKINIRKAFDDATYSWIVLSILISILSHYMRAVRWRMLIKPLGHNPNTNNTFFAVMIGYLANLALPRMGEVTRCGILAKYEKIPFNKSFGTVIAERAIDMITVVLVFFITLVMEMDLIYAFAEEHVFIPFSTKISGILKNTSLLTALIMMLLIIAGAIYFLIKKMKGAMAEKVKELLLGIWEGLKTVNKLESPGWFYFHSVFIWFLYYLSLHVSFLAFEEISALGVGPALSVLVFGSLGIMFVPGGTGAYQALVIATLSIYTISYPVAFAFAWVGWASQLISILLVGGASLVLIPILNKDELPRTN